MTNHTALRLPDDFIAPPCYAEIEILHQDPDFLLINKPSGLLSLSGKNPVNKDSVHWRLLQQYPSASLVHRLDFGTSGIMLVALNKTANAILGKQFQAGSTRKHYIAVLSGQLTQVEGWIEAAIAKDPALFPAQKICANAGKPARTHYRVLARNDAPASTRVEFTPMTGRTHQLRIHSRELGHPILGCDIYGTDVTRALAPRLLLHASELHFDHPRSGARFHVTCPCPF